MRLTDFPRRIATDCRGATAIEYGLILALVFLAMIGGVQALGNGSTGSWGDMASKAVTAMSS